MADVDVAVRIGWAVMQDEFFGAAARVTDLPVHVFSLPVPQPSRLPVRKIAFHGEGGFGQVQGVFVVVHGYGSGSDPEMLFCGFSIQVNLVLQLFK